MNLREALQDHPFQREVVAEFNRNFEDNNGLIPEAPALPEGPELVPVVDEIPGNNTSIWYTYQPINETDIRTGDILEFQRVKETRIGSFPYQHWAIYIGLFKIKAENGEIIKFRHAISHLDGRSPGYEEPYPCVRSELRAPSLGHLEEQIKDSVAWRINNADLPDHRKKERLEIFVLALAAAKYDSSPVAEEFRTYNIISRNCEHYVKYIGFGVNVSEQTKLKNIYQSLRRGLTLQID